MNLLDSNIVIYACQPANDWLRAALTAQPFAVSAITRVEVLGWHQLTADDQADLEAFLSCATVHPVSHAVIQLAILLRQQKKMKLGDAIIAATAIHHGCELVTRNDADFKHLPALTIINPFHVRQIP